MSNIDKQWLQQKIAEMEAARDEIPFGLDEGDSNTLAALSIALASLEAEPVFEVEVSGNHWLNAGPVDDSDFSGMPDGVNQLYTATPAPVSVPDELSRQEYKRRFMEEDNFDDTFRGGWNACRAAMLQGAEPVTTAYKLPELTDSQCLEFLAVAFRHARIKGDIECDDIRLGLKLALEAAPQQEV